MPLTEIHELVAAAGGAAGILLLALVAAAPWMARHAQTGAGPPPRP